ncbi:hypothetical protein GYH30_035253 [Glycine max]|uniref:Retrotransposon Copia-like N-terminal domain-containing protein n=1 Tax=Glycine max TaxID=3847 RepID=K7LXM2_SOYBN|nr:hypothetical protein GYH30_035253 [Glycine max]
MEKTVKVGEDGPSYSKWVIEDAVAQGWLSKTMEPHLIGMFIELPTARDIWDRARNYAWKEGFCSRIIHAMVSKTASGMRPRSLRDLDEAKKDKIRCSHCNATRHKKETCFELHSYPEWFLEKRRQKRAKGKRSGQAKLIDYVAGIAAVATSQGSSVDVTEPTDNSGTICVTLMVSTGQDTGWVNDSGATDHMAYDSSFFKLNVYPQKIVL